MGVGFNCPVWVILCFCFFCFALNPVFIHAQDAQVSLPIKSATAVRIDPDPPEIDGVLDDEIWRTAPAHEGFLQQEPEEGKEATERTTFQIAYDEEAIYFGIQCYDSEPDEIVCYLTRRDGYVESDRISVQIDAHHDHQTGYWFSVYASGSISDGVLSNSGWPDSKWDSVWEVETKLHDQGWTAEYRIPYHVLRFNPKEEYIWGLNIERYISRKKERTQWVLKKIDEPGTISRFGHLEGIRGIHPPMHLELIPYAMGRVIREDENDYSGSIGADVRYDITSSISVNATVNPDFGQVEEDPSLLNLTAFEDYFPERRPFFVEGASVYRNLDYGLFHSRRVGRRPGYFDVPDDVEELERPSETTILGAAKITGKTESKTSFGIMEAVTAPEYATIKQEAGGAESEFLIEPLTNYLVGRVTQDVLAGTSKIGLMTTAVNRRNAASAYTGALDWDLKFRKDTYGLSGTLAGSRAGDSDDRKSGYISHIEFDKYGGWLTAEASLAAISPDLDINDIGFLRRSDVIESRGRLSARRNTPLGPLREVSIRAGSRGRWNYDGILLEKSVDSSASGELKNYWRLHLHFGRDFETLDDDDVRRDGPLIRSPANYFIHGSIDTDDRKAVSFRIRPSLWRHDDGSSYKYDVDMGLEIRPAPGMLFSLGPSFGHSFSDAQWVDRIEEEIDGKEVIHYVYGELDSKTLDFTTRASVSFTPELSLELFLQPFIAIGDYENIKELVEPETYDFRPYSLDENKDFHRRSLKSNLVLRWEFRPGSTLFVVWSQSRSASLEDVTSDDLEFRPLDRLGSAFSDDGSNLFLIKVNYWFGT